MRESWRKRGGKNEEETERESWRRTAIARTGGMKSGEVCLV